MSFSKEYDFLIHWEGYDYRNKDHVLAREAYEKNAKQFCIDFNCLPQKQYRIGAKFFDPAIIETITIYPDKKEIWIKIKN